ncbi:hypothetical protein Achl_1148 [Pseudarthrobacter chlorophenolicus A6]|uniref:Uncharacterized protein n=1 Tax=Pseudarthrobacter chlorophenolicus (strain ATCC 700700 / DSM 12829 / CIP 107037 / JCM 12360 / KCTC 9906 / NCIMB 13794 / A6) TaxID=452863 RepID=B8HEA4_PSECP|nr:hypothetical protein [Pseudarthrobacter chlorophenolicus]ACL39139.1 hypothetical protein Achl_1148 [Pseudarthrobacter chlorophenolicus A6]SDR03750.1 hypothetical protein SAMN04489738_4379 [Pseudarthrobacter chlorophenolicus]
METLKKIVRNQYFPAGAVLAAVILFWLVGILGGLSLLHNNQPPLTTLTWLLFVYTAAVLTPLAGLLAAVDLFRRWRRNRAAMANPADAFVPAENAVNADGVIEYAVDEEPAEQARVERTAAQSVAREFGASEPAAGPSAQDPAPYDHAQSTAPESREQEGRPATPPRPSGQPLASGKKPKQPGGRKAA